MRLRRKVAGMAGVMALAFSLPSIFKWVEQRNDAEKAEEMKYGCMSIIRAVQLTETLEDAKWLLEQTNRKGEPECQ